MPPFKTVAGGNMQDRADVICAERVSAPGILQDKRAREVPFLCSEFNRGRTNQRSALRAGICMT